MGKAAAVRGCGARGVGKRVASGQRPHFADLGRQERTEACPWAPHPLVAQQSDAGEPCAHGPILPDLFHQETTVQMNAYLTFSGQCEAAFKFYTNRPND